MSIDWQALARRLAQPWWGPYPPHRYVVVRPASGAPVGLGKIVDWHTYGVWNLTLLERGSFNRPESIEEMALWFDVFQKAKKVAAGQVLGQDLGSYTMLMKPVEFRGWVQKLPDKALKARDRNLLLDSTDRLIANSKPEEVR